MAVFGIILLEFIALVAVIYGFAFWDQPLKKWEDRQIRKLKAVARCILRKLCSAGSK